MASKVERAPSIFPLFSSTIVVEKNVRKSEGKRRKGGVKKAKDLQQRQGEPCFLSLSYVHLALSVIIVMRRKERGKERKKEKNPCFFLSQRIEIIFCQLDSLTHCVIFTIFFAENFLGGGGGSRAGSGSGLLTREGIRKKKK